MVAMHFMQINVRESRREDKQNKNTTQYVLDTTIRTQAQIT